MVCRRPLFVGHYGFLLHFCGVPRSIASGCSRDGVFIFLVVSRLLGPGVCVFNRRYFRRRDVKMTRACRRRPVFFDLCGDSRIVVLVFALR